MFFSSTLSNRFFSQNGVELGYAAWELRGLRGNYGVYATVTGSKWRLLEAVAMYTPQQPRTPRNCHVDPVTATR